jgi:hypothetical protein
MNRRNNDIILDLDNDPHLWRQRELQYILFDTLHLLWMWTNLFPYAFLLAAGTCQIATMMLMVVLYLITMFTGLLFVLYKVHLPHPYNQLTHHAIDLFRDLNIAEVKRSIEEYEEAEHVYPNLSLYARMRVLTHTAVDSRLVARNAVDNHLHDRPSIDTFNNDGFMTIPKGEYTPCSENDDIDCVVCMDPLKSAEVVVLECQHALHFSCFNKYATRVILSETRRCCEISGKRFYLIPCLRCTKDMPVGATKKQNE